MTRAAAPEAGQGRRPHVAFLLLAAVLVLGALGMLVRPEGAVPRWEIGGQSERQSTPLNALAIAKSNHRRHRGLLHPLAVSYKVEGRSGWSPQPVRGCNDKWTVSVRSLFGVEVSRAEILCDGVEVNWVRGER